MIIASANVPGERETLIEIYNDQRRSFLIAVEGVSEEDARRTVIGDLTLGGLVKHLAVLEKYWIQTIVDADPEATFEPPSLADRYRLLDGETIQGWLVAYREQAQATDEFIATVPDLDVLVPIPTAPWATTRQHQTVRRILVHLFRETAHHSGHADLIREAIDGQSTTQTLASDPLRSVERN